MRKMLLLLALTASLIIYFVQQKNMILPVFSVLEAPSIITKGQNGVTLIVELSFLHDDFESLLPLLKEKQAILLIDPKLAARFPTFTEKLREQKIVVGLYSEQPFETIEQFQLEISEFEKHFLSKPLYFTHKQYMLQPSFLTYLHEQQINMVAPTAFYHEQIKSIAKGSLLFVQIHPNNVPSISKLRTFIEKQRFLSIEENIFGYSTKSKRYP